MWAYFLMLAPLLGVAILILRRNNRRERDGRWHPTLGWKMHRWSPDGSWQYRDMTKSEKLSYKDDYDARQY